jgi:uncharacterized membrane protein SpoIIM required for sporulation
LSEKAGKEGLWSEGMASAQWIDKRRPHWERLEALCRRAGNGPAGLSHAELQELGLLYRQTASDLSVAQGDPSSGRLAPYLNQLLGRSHNLIYLGKRPKAAGIVEFYRDAYPRVFRETLPQTLAAVLVFLAATLGGWAITLHDPGFAHRLLGPQMMETIERREMWTHSVVTIKPVAASVITTNNLTVSFTMFAAGITAVGTLWLTMLNGLLLGTVGAATWRAGMAVSFWSFVAPHGVLELPAICIAAGAGLEVARGWLFPGVLPRRESLGRAGRRASQLVLGTIPMLLVAGTIEGFFSPTNAPTAMKFSLAGVLLAALLSYLFRWGHRPRQASGAEPHPDGIWAA